MNVQIYIPWYPDEAVHTVRFYTKHQLQRQEAANAWHLHSFVQAHVNGQVQMRQWLNVLLCSGIIEISYLSNNIDRGHLFLEFIQIRMQYRRADISCACALNSLCLVSQEGCYIVIRYPVCSDVLICKLSISCYSTKVLLICLKDVLQLIKWKCCILDPAFPHKQAHYTWFVLSYWLFSFLWLWPLWWFIIY